jgi:hypothetical protein
MHLEIKVNVNVEQTNVKNKLYDIFRMFEKELRENYNEQSTINI